MRVACSARFFFACVGVAIGVCGTARSRKLVLRKAPKKRCFFFGFFVVSIF
jgi:hypothetical protein